MLKSTWSVPCSSSLSQQSRINHRVVDPASHISTMSLKTLNANKLGFLLSLRNTSSNSKMDKIKCNCVLPGAPSGGPWNSWRCLVFGLALILPFWKSKWGPLGPLLAFKNKIDSVMNIVVTVAKDVENVSKKVEDIADDMDKKIPQSGKLHSTVQLVERIAKEIVKDAHLVHEIIEEVEKTEEKLDPFLKPTEDEAAKEQAINVDHQPIEKDN